MWINSFNRSICLIRHFRYQKKRWWIRFFRFFDEYQQKEVEYDLDDDEDDDQIVPSQSGEKEYKDMSQSELKDLVDMYLDSGEFGEIEKIRPYLKESIDMRIYFEKQVQKIKESKKWNYSDSIILRVKNW